MNRFRNISLVYECGPSTLARAAKLAHENRARLTVLYPIKELAPAWSHLTVGQTRIDVRKMVHQEARARLKEVVESLKLQGVRAAARLVVGEPFLEIIRDVMAHGRDLVIMTAEGKGGLRERLFGSTSMHLMRKCPAPVLVMKPGRQKSFRRIVAAIDPDTKGGTRDTLNSTILELASSLSVREDAALHVVHAWTFYGEALVRGRGIHSQLVDLEIAKEDKRRRELIDALLARHAIAKAQVHCMKGDAASVMAHFVTKNKIDMLVMGTVCRSGIPGLIIGNTAERVLDNVDCSVLTVKPAGFVSPVTTPILPGDA